MVLIGSDLAGRSCRVVVLVVLGVGTVSSALECQELAWPDVFQVKAQRIRCLRCIVDALAQLAGFRMLVEWQSLKPAAC